MQEKIRIVEISAKSEYEIGIKLGEMFKDFLQKDIKKYEERLKNKKIKEAIKKIEKKLQKEYPQYLEEIYGRADGAKVDRLALLLMFCPEIYKAIGGCTTIITKSTDNRVLFAHNEDGRNKTLDMLAIVKINFNQEWVVGYIFANKLLGSAFAYNSHGMVFSNNYIYGVKNKIENVSRYFMVRDLMFSKNMDEVIQKVNKIEIASAFSLNVLDIKKKEVFNIEKEHDKTDITNITEKYARSNHLLVRTKDEKDIPETSIFRYRKANELLEKLDVNNIKIEELVQILQYSTKDYNKTIFKDRNYFSELKKSTTCATFAFDTLNNKVMIYDYISKERIAINYDSFKTERKELV